MSILQSALCPILSGLRLNRITKRAFPRRFIGQSTKCLDRLRGSHRQFQLESFSRKAVVASRPQSSNLTQSIQSRGGIFPNGTEVK